MTNELRYRARLWELYFFLYGVLQHFINALFLKVGMFGYFLA
ncbi:hypothetical protein B0I18_104182 [Taibaiella chishuiensis]|uniref:Uncharacterized protein n=1 Tax=Taibaiella chishuiensis TaxID=1434707 RepID=A0A2P8D4D6_9BACT|nr:hypothetical protein B0I18_104182 [Taibaiella chishuiensis]